METEVLEEMKSVFEAASFYIHEASHSQIIPKHVWTNIINENTVPEVIWNEESWMIIDGYVTSLGDVINYSLNSSDYTFTVNGKIIFDSQTKLDKWITKQSKQLK